MFQNLGCVALRGLLLSGSIMLHNALSQTFGVWCFAAGGVRNGAVHNIQASYQLLSVKSQCFFHGASTTVGPDRGSEIVI